MKKHIKASIPYCVLGIIFIFLSNAVRTLTVYKTLEWNTAFLVKNTLLSVIIGVVTGFIVYALLLPVQKFDKAYSLPDKRLPRGVFFAISLIVNTVCWIPYFLAYYPGILSYDSYIQIEQIASGAYNEHHPLMHTLLIRFFMTLGDKAFKSVNAGIAIYCLFQCVILAAVISYAIAVLHDRMGSIPAIVVMIVMAIFPINGYMSVTVTKDILYSAAFLLTVVSFSEYVSLQLDTGSNTAKKILNDILLFIGVFGICVLRNNGKYALALMILAMLVFEIRESIIRIKNKKSDEKKKKVIHYETSLIVCMASMCMAIISLLVISKTLNASQGDRREMLSIPIQQIARVYKYHSDELDNESLGLINEFILNGAAENYRQDISDPVKRNVNTYVVRYHTKEFVKVYIKLFRQYPGEYINAFLAENAGFLDIGDESHAHINETAGKKGVGYIQTAWAEWSLKNSGLKKDSKWEGLNLILENFASNNDYLNVPIIRYIFMPGIYLWIVTVSLIYVFSKKRYVSLIPYALLAGYYLTMFFGPTVQLRYIYPIMLCVPFIGLLTRSYGDIDEG